MLLKLCLLSCLALLAAADNSIESNAPDAEVVAVPVPVAAATVAAVPTETRVEHSVSVSFETSHKRPDALGDDAFQTAHKISPHDLDADYVNLQANMQLLPTKERPELNPVLSALINEDVMKSIEAKRAIEQEELEYIKAEVDAAIAEEEAKLRAATEETNVLTTAAPTLAKPSDLEDDDINVGFVDQTINLDAAGSENSKKSRIEIKKGPNGQDYEYEYVYYYEDEEDDSKAKASAPVEKEPEARGKSRYTNIDRSTTATPADNSLVNGKSKGRSSGAVADGDGIETERLPLNTRFPSRGKNIEVQPTPALDSLENAAEKKKISVKRPSLELVDSQTFNTDEKQAKGTRNGDTETKPALAIEKEQAAAAAAAAERADVDAKNLLEKAAADGDTESATARSDDEVGATTPTMEKAALDLYAILANENFNMDMTTDTDTDATTVLPGADEGGATTVLADEPSSTSTTTTTTTSTTTEAPTTTTTTTTTTQAPLFGGRRGLGTTGRNRFKLKQGGITTTTSTTEASASSEPSKPIGKNRFSRPPIGGRSRPNARTTAAPAPSSEPAAEEEQVAVKEVKPVSSGFGRGRPRNRFNLRGSTTTTERSAEESAVEGGAAEEAVSSTTARALRARPTLNLRGRSRTTTTRAPETEDKDKETASDDASEPAAEEKPVAAAAAPVRPSRFNLNRASGNRLLPRGKLGRSSSTTTETPVSDDDSAVDSSHHNDVKGSGEDTSETSDAPPPAPSAAAGGLNRLKSRPRLNNPHKTESVKPKVAPAPLAPRKVNPLLAKRRLHLGHSTTEAAPSEEEAAGGSAEAEPKEETASTAADAESAKDETTEESETTTKATQARGLGLLGQRRRLPIRKPGTLL